MDFLTAYETAKKERQAQGIPPLPLSAEDAAQVVELLKSNPTPELLTLLEERVSPGVDEAAYVKAAFLNDILLGNTSCALIPPVKAVQMLGVMLGGYNVDPLVHALSHNDATVAQAAANALKNIILVYDAFNTVETLAKTNPYAKEVMLSWARRCV